ACAALREPARLDPSFGREVVERLIDLAPPGLDELLGLLELLAAVRPTHSGARPYDLVVVDTAPTGHTLRLLAMPQAGLEWIHAFMALWLKYRKVIGLGELGWDLVSLARDLRDLQSLLGNGRQARAVVVTRPGELPGRETRRLITGLRGLGVVLSGVIMNTVASNGCARCSRAHVADRRALASLTAVLARDAPDSAIVAAPV